MNDSNKLTEYKIDGKVLEKSEPSRKLRWLEFLEKWRTRKNPVKLKIRETKPGEDPLEGS